MNTEDFVTYEQALALKKLGFDENSFYHYNTTKQLRANFSINAVGCIIEGYFLRNNTDFSSCVVAPTLAQAQKWLREVKHLHISPMYDGSNIFATIIYDMDNDNKYKILKYPQNSYEEAISAGITECLELLEKDN